MKASKTVERTVVEADSDTFYVTRPDTLEYYTVTVDAAGNLTCHHRSDYGTHKDDPTEGRCWPWHLRSTCCHCDAVDDFLTRKNVEEAVAHKADAQRRSDRLVELFDYSRP